MKFTNDLVIWIFHLLESNCNTYHLEYLLCIGGLMRYHVDPSQLLSLGITYQLLHTKLGSQAIDVIEDWGPFLWYYNYTYVVWNSFLLLKCYSRKPNILVKITHDLTITYNLRPNIFTCSSTSLYYDLYKVVQ